MASLQASVTASDRHLAQLKSAYASDLRSARIDAVGKITQLEQERAKLQCHKEHLELRAPQAGVVKELTTTTIGAVVQPGTVLLSLVPRNELLLAEVSIQNEDIGFVREGQPVRVKLATYPFQKYGTLDGVVKTLIADFSSQQQSTRNDSGSATDAGVPQMSFKAMIDCVRRHCRRARRGSRLRRGCSLARRLSRGSARCWNIYCRRCRR